jgi:hypothetical protein
MHSVYAAFISVLYRPTYGLCCRSVLLAGTCAPICYVAFLYKLLGLLDADIVFVESFCRVQHLSITGKLLYHIADRFIVQWPSLARQYPRAEYLGDFSTKPISVDSPTSQD